MKFFAPKLTDRESMMIKHDLTELFDRHIKEHTSNGNATPGEEWYEEDYKSAAELLEEFNDLDWHVLKKMFGARSQIWQEACVFVLGNAGTEGSASMLADIFVRGHDAISCYAAVFLADENLDTFEEDVKRRIRLRAHDLFKDSSYREHGEHYRISLEKIREKLRPV